MTVSRAAKTIHCAQNVKTVRLSTEFNKSILQHFSDMPHIVAFPRWPPLTLRVPHGTKIETFSDFSEKMSNCLSCPKDSKKCIV